MSKLLMIPHLTVQKANAHASSVSAGFPALTGFYGFVHALERQLNQAGITLQATGFGIATYHVDNHRQKKEGDYTYSLKDQGKPLKADGGRPSTVECATCDMDITIIIEINTLCADEDIVNTTRRLLHSKLKVCGGDIINSHKPWVTQVTNDNEFRWLKKILMPAQIITSRHDLLLEHMHSSHDALQSILDLTALHHSAHQLDTSVGDEERYRWVTSKRHPGWLVPIGVGFYPLGPLKDSNHVLHTRDQTTPHRFAEPLVTLCEFKLAYRFNSLSELLWKAEHNEQTDLYVIKQIKN